MLCLISGGALRGGGEGIRHPFDSIFSSLGRSPGRAIVLPPASASVLVLAAASALAKSLTLEFFM